MHSQSMVSETCTLNGSNYCMKYKKYVFGDKFEPLLYYKSTGNIKFKHILNLLCTVCDTYYIVSVYVCKYRTYSKRVINMYDQ